MGWLFQGTVFPYKLTRLLKIHWNIDTTKEIAVHYPLDILIASPFADLSKRGCGAMPYIENKITMCELNV